MTLMDGRLLIPTLIQRMCLVVAAASGVEIQNIGTLE
jgi:hypothetical protein